MPEILRTNDTATDATIDRYYDDALALARAALDGMMTQREYLQRQIDMSWNSVRAVFLLAGGDENNRDAIAWLSSQEALIRSSSIALARDLYNGRYSKTEKQTQDEGLEKLSNRVVLWLAMLGRAYHRGNIYSLFSFRQRVGTWHTGLTEHCGTCLAQDGQTRTADEWALLAAQGIEPQGGGLECGGFNCKCGIDWRYE